MNNIPDQNAMEQAKRLAQSPAGQQLLQMIRQAGSADVEAARQQAAAGDMEQARQTLSKLLRTPQIQSLIREMGGSNG